MTNDETHEIHKDTCQVNQESFGVIIRAKKKSLPLTPSVSNLLNEFHCINLSLP